MPVQINGSIEYLQALIKVFGDDCTVVELINAFHGGK